MSFLTKKIFDSTGQVFGLDLSDLSVKAALFEKNGKYDRLISYGKVPIPTGSVYDGEIVKEETVVNAIKNVLEKAVPKKIKTKKVICSLPETKAFLRIINMPRLSHDEIREAIKWEIEANIPLTLDQVYYDWQILETNLASEKNKISVLVVAVSRKTVDQFIGVLEAAGLEVYGLEIESIAQTRALISKQSQQKTTTFIIDLGDRRTSFLISIGSTPCFTSSIPISSQSMTDALSKSFNVSFDEAEKMKFNYGIGSVIEEDLVFRTVKPILEGIISEMERTIDFYLGNLKYSSCIDDIIVCGGGANTKGIIPYLSRRLNNKVELGNPWSRVNLKNEIPIIERKESVQYSTAIGLALRGLEYDSYQSTT